MKKNIRNLICMLAFVMLFIPKTGYAQTIEDYINSVQVKNQMYNTELSPAYLRNNVTEEYVNPQSGELNVVQSDYVLPGKNGLDLEIKRIYKTEASNIFETVVEYDPNNQVWINREPDAKTASFYENRYDLGIGSRFSFPTMEIVTGTDNNNIQNRIVHTDSGDIYNLVSIQDINGKKAYKLATHGINDVVLIEDPNVQIVYDSESTSPQIIETAKYVMVDQQGRKTYFSDISSTNINSGAYYRSSANKIIGNDGGRVLAIEDKYGNQIKFKYNTFTTLAGDRKLVSEIKDTLGRTVTVNYDESTSTVTLILPALKPGSTTEHQTMVYKKSDFLKNTDGAILRTKLDSVTDVDGNSKYTFNYETVTNLKFDYTANNDPNTVNAQYTGCANLSRIDFARYNRSKRFTYDTFVKKIGSDGIMQYRKVVKNEDVEKVGSNETVKSSKTYNYTKSPDRYELVPTGTTLPDIVRDFQNQSDLNGAITSGYTKPWTRITNTDGSSYIGSAKIYDNQTSGIILPIQAEKSNGSQTLQFKYKISSEASFDYLIVKVNGTQVLKESGLKDATWNNFSTNLPVTSEGKYNIEFIYSKNGSIARGSDACYVDDLKITGINTNFWKYNDATTKELAKYDFEGPLEATPEIRMGDIGWERVADNTHDGNWVLKNKIHTDDKIYPFPTVYLPIRVDGAGTISFDYMINTAEYECFKVSINGTLVLQKEGNIPWTNVKLDLKEGQNVIVFWYERDVWGYWVDNDFCYIDNLVINYDSYKYYTEIDDTKGKTKYTYNSAHELVKTEIIQPDHTETIEKQFNAEGLPCKVTSIKKDNVGNSSASIENYQYDSVGNITCYTGPNAERDSYGEIVQNGDFERADGTAFKASKKSVVYDYAKKEHKKSNGTSLGTNYYVPSLKECYQNDTDTDKLRIDYQSDEYGNITKEIKSNTIDYADRTVTIEYKYDDLTNKGNLTDKLVYSNDLPERYLIHYSYDKLVDADDCKNAYLTQEEIVEKDSQGNIIHSIPKQYNYDYYTGNRTEVIENGQKTVYTYDILNRITNITYPQAKAKDGTHNIQKSYLYTDSASENRRIEYTDPEGNIYVDTYDVLGHIVEKGLYLNKSKSAGNYKKTKMYEYNTAGQETSETDIKEVDASGNIVNANVTAYEYIGDRPQHIGYYKYSVENSVPQKELKEEISYSYQYGLQNISVRIIKTDGEGGVSKSDFDTNGRLTDEYKTSDGSMFYKKHTEYDNTGNVKEVTDYRGNITSFTYDRLNRLILKTDALSNKTKYTYNALDKLCYQYEQGKATYYTYDFAGRITQEDQSGDVGGSIYTKYEDYDNAGNAKSIRKGCHESKDADVDSEHTTYEYDNINRVTDERKDIDDTLKTHTHYTYDDNSRKKRVTEYLSADETAAAPVEQTDYTYDLTDQGDATTVTAQVLNYANANSAYIMKKVSTNDFAGNLINEKRYSGDDYLEFIYKYDCHNKIEEKTEPFEKSGTTKTTSYTYNKAGNLQTQKMTINGVDCITQYQYDKAGNLKQITYPEGNITTYTYDANNNKTAQYGANNSMYEYDALNRLTKTYIGDQVVSYQGYDGMGNINKKADGEGYLINPSNPAGQSITYDCANRPIKIENSDTGTKNETAYDGSGRVIQEKDGYGNTTSYEYYMNGQLKKKTYPDGIVENYSYNVDITQSDYDYTGKYLTTKKDPAGNTTTYYNNIFGSTNKIIYPDSIPESFEYNQYGFMTKVTDRNLNSIVYDYNNDGTRISEEKEFYTSTTTSERCKLKTEYTYNEAGFVKTNKSKVAQATQVLGGYSWGDYTDINHGMLYTYDKNNRLIRINGPCGMEVLQSYNQAGNLAEKKVCSNGEAVYDITTYEYDVGGRLGKEITKLQSSDIYDGEGLAIRNIPQTSGTAYAVKYYEYYNSMNVKSIADNYNNKTTYTYNSDGKVTKTESIDPQGGVVARKQFKYDNSGNVQQEISGNGSVTTYDYDSRNRLIRKNVPSAAGTATTRYIYDNNNNIIKEIQPNSYNLKNSSQETTQLLDAMPGMRYVYDVMNRKIATFKPVEENGTITYKLIQGVQYDNIGNISKNVDGLNVPDIGVDASIESITAIIKSESTKGIVYNYDSFNRVISTIICLKNSDESNTEFMQNYQYNKFGWLEKQIDQRGKETSYEYYDNGAVKKITYPDNGTVEYTYDNEGRKLTEKRLQNMSGRYITTTYEYNGFGKLRSAKDDYGNKEEYAYDYNGNVAAVKDKRGSTTYYSYNAAGKISAKRQPVEQNQGAYAIERYNYDLAGNVSELIRTGTKDTASKRVTKYTYYGNNQSETTTQTSGAYTKQYYDKNGNNTMTEVLREEISDGKPAVYEYVEREYDINNNLTKVINKVKATEIYNADGYDSLKGNNENAGYILIPSGYEYDIMGNKTKEKTPLYYTNTGAEAENYAVKYEYDNLGRLSKTTSQYKGTPITTEYMYDASNNKKQEKVTADTNTPRYTLYYYDAMNRLVSYSNANDVALSIAKGQSLFNINGAIVEYASENLIKTMQYTYDYAGNKLSEKNAKYTTIYTYDKLNRLTDVVNNEHINIMHKEYDANGNLQKQIDALGHETTYEYNPANVLTAYTDPDTAERAPGKKTMRYEYNQYGEKTAQTNALDETTKYEYTTAALLKSVTDPLEHTITYDYDQAGNKISMTDAKGKITTYKYGENGKVLETIDPENKSQKFLYDIMGNLAVLTDKKEMQTYYSYDSRNALVQKTAGADTISYEYDPWGNRSKMIDTSGETTYNYDANNRLTQISANGSSDSQIAYTYDEVGNMDTITTSGKITDYDYDSSNRLVTVRNGTQDNMQEEASYQYDNNGNIKKIIYPNGITAEYDYYKNNKLRTLVNKKDATTYNSYAYEYDLAGRQNKKVDNGVETTYSYDASGRIWKASTSDKKTEYLYDENNNRLSMTEYYTSEQNVDVNVQNYNTLKYTQKETQYMYSDLNKMQYINEKYMNATGEVLQKATNYVYDANGNQTNRTVSYEQATTETAGLQVSSYTDDATSFDNMIDMEYNQYDGFNRLKSIESIKEGTKTKTEFTYNGDDLRVEKRSHKGSETHTTQYLYDRGNVITETKDTIRVNYVSGLSYIARIEEAKTSRYLYNGHGDVTQTVAENGTVENQYDYDIFGNPTLTVENNYSNAIRYAGEFYDNETGLYYLRSRYYSPFEGRFMTEDTYAGQEDDPLSLNLYTYCHNDPINFTDPTGHYEEGDEDLPYDAQEAIIAATNDYYAATTDEGREAAHQRAVDIRNNPSEYSGAPTVAYDGFHSQVTEALSHGELSSDQWSSIAALAPSSDNEVLFSGYNGVAAFVKESEQSGWNGWLHGDDVTSIYSTYDGYEYQAAARDIYKNQNWTRTANQTMDIYSEGDLTKYTVYANEVWGTQNWAKTAEQMGIKQEDNSSNKGNNASNSDIGNQGDSSNKKVYVIVYVANGFKTLTEEDSDKLLNLKGDVQFVFCTSNFVYNQNNGVQIINPDDVGGSDKLKDFLSLVDKTNGLSTHDLSSMNDQYSLVRKQLDDLKVLQSASQKNSKELNIWFALPHIPSNNNAVSADYENAYIGYMKTLQQNVDKDTWNNNVKGFYFGTEGLDDGLPFYNNPQGHPIVAAANTLSQVVHNDMGKQMLWAPYIGNGDNLNRVAYVANETNIFDTVFIQPGYYFDDTHENAMPVVRESADQQKVITDLSNSQWVSKNSNTKIGVVMELDSQKAGINYINDYQVSYTSEDDVNKFNERYSKYQSTFIDNGGNYPVMIYSGYPNSMMNPNVFDDIQKISNAWAN